MKLHHYIAILMWILLTPAILMMMVQKINSILPENLAYYIWSMMPGVIAYFYFGFHK